MRDIEKYTEEYLQPGFEKYQVHYRRKKILEIVAKYPHESILEIGCGMEPLFAYLSQDDFQQYMVVEPSREFYANAVKLAKNDKRIILRNCLFAVTEEIKNYKFNLIILSCLLYEVENPNYLLREVHSICCKESIVHVNVPNADSVHRLLAQKMGLIKTVDEPSERNKIFQQHSVFSMGTLVELAESEDFVIADSGSYFIKPFTHGQMYEMLKHKIIDERVLDGLYAMSSVFPQYGSEIYVNLRINR